MVPGARASVCRPLPHPPSIAWPARAGSRAEEQQHGAGCRRDQREHHRPGRLAGSVSATARRRAGSRKNARYDDRQEVAGVEQRAAG